MTPPPATDLLTAADMNRAERAAMDAGTASGRDLMERAGDGVVSAIFERWPDLTRASPDTVVLCGPGNNGGDGFVIARLLAERGWDVRVVLYGDAGALPSDAQANHDRWCALGPVAPWPGRDAGIPEAGLIVDALFGTGLTRPLDQRMMASDMLPVPGEGNGRIVAVDLPSGLCSDSGRALGGRALRADLTVTFHRPKLGHYLAEGPSRCGAVVCRDIGLAPGPAAARLVGRPKGLSKADPSRGPSHKFDYGHAMVLSGGVGRGGAARMAARGCLRAGAGLVTLGCPPAALIENASRLDAIMLRPVKGAAALAAALEDERLNALCLGPGLGTGAREAALVGTALGSGRAVVLDGDALTLVADHRDLAERLHGRCVLTPHGGEFARLCPDIADRLSGMAMQGPAYSKHNAARDAAKRLGAVVAFKGPDTVIAAPDGEVRIHAACYDRAAPWLATAGAGDVLAGIVTGLLARGWEPLDAASKAAWMHAEAAMRFGAGLIAEDLPDELPGVLRDLER